MPRVIRKKNVLLSFLKVCNDVTNGFHDSNKVEDLRVVHPSFAGPYYTPPDIVGHCDGIICLNFSFYDESYPNNDDIVLFNPAIKESELLPESCLCRPPQHKDHVRVVNLHNVGVGFGYNFKAKTYKVVRIDREFPGPDIQGRDAVLSFNMGEEAFHSIPAPYESFERCGCYNSLAVWNESVSLFSYQMELDSGRYGYVFDIWVMDNSSDQVKNKVDGVRNS
ncbi:uncharacterized protein LOC103941441 [Pyrus x bretschneideri]|uniref:uncharacterized protein LOC103941441 n=1 Tax=Pyrus x bretschneideri TaxID=225117 RepID=UPI00202EC478|nr:uncharacterized protein LOC103941441 [Pyrus x bretschneideri]